MSHASLRRTLEFTSALSDQTGGQPKVFRRDYLSEGALPVIDQGAAPVAGYTNDERAAYKGPLPVLLFGDHTRLLKYVDVPFALGADGVKVLQAAPWYEPKFLYYYLLTQDIPDRGYSRHFNLLKQVRFPFFPRSEQRRIVEILDQADRLRRLRAAADAKADRIPPALFIKMFGDPAINQMGWPVKNFGCLLVDEPRNGMSPSTDGRYRGLVLSLAAITGAAFNDAALKEAFFARPPAPDKQVDDRDFLICRGNGNLALVGRGRFSKRSIPGLVFPDTVIAARIDLDQIDRAYLETLWACPYLRSQIESRARTTSGIHKINHRTIGALDIPVPPIDLQRRFGVLARELAAVSEGRTSASITRLFDILLDRALAGQLTASWRAAHMSELTQEMEHQAKILDAAAREG